MVNDTFDRSSSGGTDRIYNIISVLMLALTALSGCVVGLLVIRTILLQTQAPVEVTPEATVAGPPSETPTLAGPTVNPTWTPSPTATLTRTPTLTLSPTITLTPTPTNTPTATATATGTPTPTDTTTPLPTNTPLPTRTNTRAPFDYVLQNGTVVYTINFANTAGCDWAGIGGQVFDINGKHKVGLRVHITGGGIDERIITGSSPAYGLSGWERSVGNAPSSGVFRVQLEDETGRLLSDVVTVQMIASCDKNLVLVNFVQIQE